MTQRVDRNGFTTPQNIVEVRTFLTAARDVTVTQNRPNSTPVVTTYTAPAGEFRKADIPLQYGTVTVTTANAGTTTATITTNVPTVSNPVVQDLGYYRWSSLRPTDTYLTPLSHL